MTNYDPDQEQYQEQQQQQQHQPQEPYQQQYQQQYQQPPQYQQQQPGQAAAYTTEEIEQSKVISALAYLGILFFLLICPV